MVEVVTVKSFEVPLTRKSRSILESKQIVSRLRGDVLSPFLCSDVGVVSSPVLVPHVPYVMCTNRATLEAPTTWPTSTTLSTQSSSTLCCGSWSSWSWPSSPSPTACGTWTLGTTASSTGWPIRRYGWTEHSKSYSPCVSLSNMPWWYLFCFFSCYCVLPASFRRYFSSLLYSDIPSKSKDIF